MLLRQSSADRRNDHPCSHRSLVDYIYLRRHVGGRERRGKEEMGGADAAIEHADGVVLRNAFLRFVGQLAMFACVRSDGRRAAARWRARYRTTIRGVVGITPSGTAKQQDFVRRHRRRRRRRNRSEFRHVLGLQQRRRRRRQR
jgi:hypothetical protein